MELKIKPFLIIGNIGAIIYKDVFPYIKSREVHYRPECYGIKEYNNTDKKVMATWYTTLIPPYIPPLVLTKSYTPDTYPKYDNYDAISVDRTNDIPCDYDGVMGVPITFLDKWNPGQFEILGLMSGAKDDTLLNGNDGRAKWYIGGKGVYARILIRHRKLF